MTAKQYYLYTRKLGAFRAIEAWELAKQAAALDNAAFSRKIANKGQDTVARETIANDCAVHLSFGIKVF